MKKILILFLPILLTGQTITWVKQTGASAPNPPYGTQWIQLLPNSVHSNTLMFGKSDNGAGNIYPNTLYGLKITDPTSATGLVYQQLGSSFTHVNSCPFSREDEPGDTQLNKGMWWDSKRNMVVEAFGVCNFGASDLNDRINWEWHYTPNAKTLPVTLGEHWQRVSLPTFNLPARPWGTGIYDSADDMHIFYSFGQLNQNEVPIRVKCPTDLNTTPGVLSTAQQTSCFNGAPDTWIEKPFGSFLCKATPSATAIACTATTIPQITALPFMTWDAGTGEVLMFGEGGVLAAALPGPSTFGIPQTWTYNPATHTFTNYTSNSTPPPSWLTNGDEIAPMAKNPNDGLIYFHQKVGISLAITSPGSGYTAGTWNVTPNNTWNVTGGTCSNRPSISYTVVGTSVASIAPNYTTMPSADCMSASVTPVLNQGGNNNAVASAITWTPAHTWTLKSAAVGGCPKWCWTDLGAQGGPPTLQSMEIDSAWNTIIGWGYTAAGTAETWLGLISGNVKPTITKNALSVGTVGSGYVDGMTAGGTGSITWTSTTMPTGLTLDSTGFIHGTPTVAATTSVTFTATNATGATNLIVPITVTAATLSVPITVQEALYPGSVAGVARTDEPFCQGIPIKDSAAIDGSKPNTLGNLSGQNGLNTLGLTGATSGQFRVLARWPSGNAKWIEVCGVISSLAAGGAASLTLTNTGSGNFGGPDMAVTDGTTNVININTGLGACGTSLVNCFTIKKLNHNGIDFVQIGTNTVVSSPGAAQLGYTVTGPDFNQPFPANVTCGPLDATHSPCNSVYSSSQDGYSYCWIEKNGPVESVITCMTTHTINAGSPNTFPRPYMRTKARYYFHKGKSWVRVVDGLLNEDLIESNNNSSLNGAPIYDTSARFGTAFKGHQGYELRIVPNISGTLTYTVANHTGTPTTGTMSGTDSVYLYQGLSISQLGSGPAQAAGSAGFVPLTTDSGYRITKNGANLLTGTNTQYPQGWADISNASGVGVEIGVKELAALNPKSLEINLGSGITDVRIGIWARENSQPYYQAWPQQSTHDLYLNFHGTALASPANEFLKFQHPLVARACAASGTGKCHDFTYINSTGVFPYKLIDPDAEDAYFLNMAANAQPPVALANACCLADFVPQMIRFWTPGATGGPNQTEFRWSYLMNFITRGMTGRYIQAQNWYRYAGDNLWPRSLGFNWRGQLGTLLDHYGFPQLTSTNASLASRVWISADTGEHAHWYGMTDDQLMTGDETIKDALLDGPKEWYGSQNVAQFYPHYFMFNARGIGANLMGASRLSTYLASIGDLDSPAILKTATDDFVAQVNQVLCTITNGVHYPAGCTMAAIDQFGTSSPNWLTTGINPIRGLFATAFASTGSPWCNNNHNLRVNKSFMDGVLEQGLLEYAETVGPNNSAYLVAKDIAYGIAQNVLSEAYKDDGSGQWATLPGPVQKNGFRYDAPPDWANNCTAAGESPVPIDYNFLQNQTVWMNLFAKHATDGGLEWKNKFDMAMSWLISSDGYNNFSPADDLGSSQVTAVIGALNSVDPVLNTVPITGVTSLGGGNYSVQWTAPAGAVSYRVKWGNKTIVDQVKFDTGTQTYIGDPVNTMPWFAASNIIIGVPAPLSAGTPQSMTIVTGVNGLTAGNFSVKAVISGAPGPLTITPVSLPATTVGATYSVSLASQVTGGILPYRNYIVASGALPSGLTLNASSGLISGTVGGSPGTATFAWSVTDSAGSPVTVTSSNETITVNAPITITTGSALTSGTFGAAYTTTLAETGGTAPFTWTLTSGSMPAGLSLAASTGVISGTPSVIGRIFTFTIMVTGAAGANGSKTFNLDIDPKFTYGSTPGTPTGCTHTNSRYAPLDLNTCTITGEVPLGTFSIPAVGSSYNDQNFGTPITVLSRNDIQGPSVTAYANPSAWSANGTYAGIAVNTATTIINPTNGTVIRGASSSPPAPGFILAATLTWSKTDSDTYYFIRNKTLLMKASVSTGIATQLMDFTTLGLTTNGVDVFNATPTAGGSGFAPFVDSSHPGDQGKTFTLACGAAGTIKTVSSGIVTAINTTPTTGGIDCTVGSGQAATCTGCTGTGLTVNATAIGVGITAVNNGGTGDISNDNWFPCFSTGRGAKLALAINLNNLHVYSSNYKIPRNGIIAPDIDGAPNGQVFASRGVDSVSGKRYFIAVSYPFIFYSVTGDPASTSCGGFVCGDLVYEQLSPEYPKNIRSQNLGNDNNVCDPTELARGECIGVQHTDMFQDRTGQQYLVGQVDFNTAIGFYRSLVYIRLNAGDLMLRSAAWEGGGRTDLPIGSTTTNGTGDEILDGHTGCAGGTDVCVISYTPNSNRAAGDLTNAYTHKTRFFITAAIKGVGEEFRSIIYTRSIFWGGFTVPLASVANTTPVQVTTQAANAVLEGMGGICINSSSTGVDVTVANRCWTAHVINSTTFSLNGSTASGASTNTGTVSTVNQYWPHGFCSLSNDGSHVICNTNFGYYTVDGNENVITAPTGMTSVGPPLVISPAISLGPSTVGAAYSANISGSASGGTGPYTWSLAPGSADMPTGVSIGSTGIISGTVGLPTGTFGPTIRLTDSTGSHVDQLVSIVINPAVVITTASMLPGATVGTPYSFQIGTSGGTGAITFSQLSGSLAGSGLAMSAGGLVSGTPIGPTHTYTLTVKAVDTTGIFDTQAFSVVVTAAVSNIVNIISPSALPKGYLATPYNVSLSAAGGVQPYVWSIVILAGGSGLPPGVTLGSNGVLSGTPTLAGNYTFTLRATDANAATGDLAANLLVGDSIVINGNVTINGTLNIAPK